MTALDRRLNAYRPDLADARLENDVAADRYVDGTPGIVTRAVVDLHPRPDAASSIDTQALLGEAVTVFERSAGWAWVQLVADGYVGYVAEDAIGQGTGQATHIVTVPRTFVYPGPDLRFPRRDALSMGSRVMITGTAETRGTAYALMQDGGAVIAAHLRPVGEPGAEDAVSVAAQFLNTPYLWGGRSGFDCSGLVQIALAMTGRSAPRDSDMQAARLGTAIDRQTEGLRRGDLVFWKGHVGFLEDPETLLHASGGTMYVTREPLGAAIDRIGRLYGQPTGYRRP